MTVATQTRKPRKAKTEQPEGLTDEQRNKLADLELRISTGMEGFVQAAHAAYLISNRHRHSFHGLPLYWPHDSYTEYMRVVHGIDKVQASRLRHAGYVMDLIDLHNQSKPDNQLGLPTNEGQCRALAKVPDYKIVELWAKVCQSEQKISAQLISDVAAKEKMEPRKPARKSKPVCKDVLTVNCLTAKPSNTLRKMFGVPEKTPEGLYLYPKTKGVRDMVSVLRKFATWLSHRGEELGIISLHLQIAEQPKQEQPK